MAMVTTPLGPVLTMIIIIPGPGIIQRQRQPPPSALPDNSDDNDHTTPSNDGDTQPIYFLLSLLRCLNHI